VGALASYSFANVSTTHTISASFAINTYSIVTTVGTNGSISGPAIVNYGGSASYTITPAVGYHVADVVVDGNSVGPVSGYSLSNVTANHVINANFAIDTVVVTLTPGANGSITGPTTVTYGDMPSYTITPASGYHIAEVTINGSSVGAVPLTTFLYTFPSGITTPTIIAATFTINTYYLTVTAGANGSISGPATINYGGSASYTITPAVGFHVADVVVDGNSVGPVASYAFVNVTANHTITASFALNTYSISATATGNGSISGPSSVNYGGSATYTITPAVGSHVVDVVVDGASVGAVSGYLFTTVTANHSISASFALNTYSITTGTAGNGSISGPATVSYRGSASYTITPAVGSHVVDVVVDGVSVGIVSSYLFANVTTNHTINASFALNTYTISATAGAYGTVSGPATVPYGGNASYTITPTAGFRVANVVVDGISVGAVPSYNFTNVKANHTISATFMALADLIVTSVTAPANANGGRAINVSSSIFNQGGTNAGSFTVTFYLSPDTAITNSDTVLGTKTVVALSAGSATTVSGSFTVPNGLPPGRYYVGVIADSGSAIAESDKSNNSRAASTTTTVR
jgi:hypothetical protein